MRLAHRSAAWALATAATLGFCRLAEAQQLGRPLSHSGALFRAQGAEVPVESRLRLAEIQVELAWLADPATFVCQLAAHSVEANLEIAGAVPSEALRRRALELACSSCDLTVIDKLIVQPNSALSITAVNDGALCRAAGEVLGRMMAKFGESFEFHADAKGQIVVQGTVPSHEEKLHVSRRLSQLTGCTSVVNNITVRGDMGRPNVLSPLETPRHQRNEPGLGRTETTMPYMGSPLPPMNQPQPTLLPSARRTPYEQPGRGVSAPASPTPVRMQGTPSSSLSSNEGSPYSPRQLASKLASIFAVRREPSAYASARQTPTSSVARQPQPAAMPASPYVRPAAQPSPQPEFVFPSNPETEPLAVASMRAAPALAATTATAPATPPVRSAVQPSAQPEFVFPSDPEPFAVASTHAAQPTSTATVSVPSNSKKPGILSAPALQPMAKPAVRPLPDSVANNAKPMPDATKSWGAWPNQPTPQVPVPIRQTAFQTAAPAPAAAAPASQGLPSLAAFASWGSGSLRRLAPKPTAAPSPYGVRPAPVAPAILSSNPSGPIQQVSAVTPVSSPSTVSATAALPTRELVRLLRRINEVCGNSSADVKIHSEAANHCCIELVVPTNAQGHELAQKIMSLPELLPYRVDLRIKIKQ